jgi:hypothetical protein
VLYGENGELKGEEAQILTILQDTDPEGSLVKYSRRTTID